jgi:hypothetical protein
MKVTSSLVAPLQSLQKRTVLELDRLYDFTTDTVVTYEMFKKYVAQEREVVFMFPARDRYTDQDELASVLDEYATNYLDLLAFRHSVSLFEAFLFDLLRLLVRSHPERLSGKKRVDVSEILSFNSLESLVVHLIDRELNEVRYKRVSEWFDYLQNSIGIECPTQDEIDQIAEIKASRDILEHNSGIVNEIYAEKAGELARFDVGEQLGVPPNYFTNSWCLMRKLVNDIADAVVDRLS